MSDDMTFEEWQGKCAEVAKRLLGFEDLLDEDDPYDVFDAMEDYYDEDADPEDFIRELFAEDLAAREYDEDLSRQADEYEDEDEDEDDEEDEDEDSE